jgi:hypothetical protein
VKRLSSFLVLLVTFSGLTPVSHSATAKTSATFYVQSTPNAGESLVTFYGQVKPAGKASVSISSFDGEVWKVTPLKTNSSSSGSWRITTVATAIKAEGKYRATVTVGKKKLTTKAADFKVDNSKTFADTNALFITPGTSKLTGGSIQMISQ